MGTRLLFLLFLIFCLIPKIHSNELVAEDDEDELTITDNELLDEDQEEEEESEPVVEPEYEVPTSVNGALLFDNFQSMDEFNAKWTHSSSGDFPGRFLVGKGGNNPQLSGENGLYVPQEAARYAIFGALERPFDFSKDETFVVQYEVRMHEALQCGGAYLKLAAQQDTFEPSDVTNETPYVFMFGPDKCGSTNKVHFIWKFQNPVTGELVEHHLKKAPQTSGTSDRKSHLYTLVVRKNNSYQIFIDKEVKSEGNLLEDFEPPLVPAQEIDDPEDLKPSDWVDEAKISDPEATQPEDWDEDAPRMIEDPDETKPSGWLDDEPLEIPAPGAERPEDWDDEDDGEWEAPIVNNPACSVGCGEWKPSMIENPEYKGKWYPPMIDNPAYVGEWAARQIPNPAYFEESNPYENLQSISGVVIDIWTMQRGIEYDNVFVGTSEDLAYALTDHYDIRRSFQDTQMKSSEASTFNMSPEWQETVLGYIRDNLIAVLVTFVILFITVMYFCCCVADEFEEIVEEVEVEDEDAVEDEQAGAEPKKEAEEPKKED